MGVLGQRLVRKVCKNCRTPFEPTEDQLGLLNLSLQRRQLNRFKRRRKSNRPRAIAWNR